MTKRNTTLALGFFATVLLVSSVVIRGADTIPNQISDDAFWKLIESSSEQSGEFQSENFLSNETGFQVVIPALKQISKSGGVYLGVGPEQNFTYIAAIRPKMAFIIDIRRQNMVEHMMYKALFELSTDRADFLSRLFSRKRPAGLSATSSVDDLFRALATAPRDAAGEAMTLQEMENLLSEKHHFGLTADDRSALEHVYTVFAQFGPDINYSSGGGGGGRGGSTYADLMTATDDAGHQWSYLVSEESYKFLRDLEGRNLIVPLTGDFGGPLAIRAAGRYVKDHGASVAAFYTSNVEQYLFQGADNQGHLNGGGTSFYNNVSTLPLDASSMFIRSGNGARGGAGNRGFGTVGRPNYLASIQETLAAVKDGRIQNYSDIFLLSR